jgi:hypothetical protein
MLSNEQEGNMNVGLLSVACLLFAYDAFGPGTSANFTVSLSVSHARKWYVSSSPKVANGNTLYFK